MTLADCPDMTEAADDISGKLAEFTQNYADYERAAATRPFLRAFFYTFKWEIARTSIIRFLINGLNICGPMISAYTYEIIRNEDKSEGFSSSIIAMVIIEMLFYVVMPSLWNFNHKVANVAGRRVYEVTKTFIYVKMMTLQVGSCPSDLSEGQILGMQAENQKIFELFTHRLPDAIRVACVVTVAGGYCLSMFGSTFAISCIVCCCLSYCIVQANLSLKDMRKKRSELQEENKSRLGEIFNNIKMLKLYGW